MKSSSVLLALASLLPWHASAAWADESPKGSDATVPGTRALVFGEGAVRATVDRDVAVGRLTFRLTDPTVKLDGAPVLVVTTDAGPRELVMSAVAGEPGTWILTDDASKARRLVATMRVVTGGRSYTATLPTAALAEPKPAHGGRLLELPACGVVVEVVVERGAGTLALYLPEGLVATEVLLLVTDAGNALGLPLSKPEEAHGAWTAKHAALQGGTTGQRIRVTVSGKACEADLALGASEAPPSRRRVTVEGGPTFEVSRGPKTGEYTFHALEETLDGQTYAIDGPTLLVDSRMYPLSSVEGEVRTWRLVGLEPKSVDALDVQLSFSISGKSFVARFDLGGTGTAAK